METFNYSTKKILSKSPHLSHLLTPAQSNRRMRYIVLDSVLRREKKTNFTLFQVIDTYI